MVYKVKNLDKSYRQITIADKVQRRKRDLQQIYPTSAGTLCPFRVSVMDTEALVTCPYNKAHRVSQRRLQHHLLKCGKHYKETTLVYCKFDTAHVVDRMEYEHHMATCPSSGHIRADKYVRESDVPVGCVGLEDINHIRTNNTDTEENWDEIDNSGNTYNPEHNLSNRHVFRMCIAGSRAEKKKFKNMERERFMKLQENMSSETPHLSIVNHTDLDTPLRSPRKPANVCSQMRSSKLLNKSTCSEQMNKTEDVLPDILVDDIASMVQKKLSLTPTSCNNSMKEVKAECREKKNANNSIDYTETSLGSIDVGINNRVSKMVDANQSVLENGAILKVEQKSNMTTTDDETVDVAKIMARYSTGRGLTRARRDLEYIERKPGVPLRRPKQQAAAVLQSQQADDTEKFSDNV